MKHSYPSSNPDLTPGLVSELDMGVNNLFRTLDAVTAEDNERRIRQTISSNVTKRAVHSIISCLFASHYRWNPPTCSYTEGYDCNVVMSEQTEILFKNKGSKLPILIRNESKAWVSALAMAKRTGT